MAAILRFVQEDEQTIHEMMVTDAQLELLEREAARLGITLDDLMTAYVMSGLDRLEAGDPELEAFIELARIGKEPC